MVGEAQFDGHENIGPVLRGVVNVTPGERESPKWISIYKWMTYWTMGYYIKFLNMVIN